MPTQYRTPAAPTDRRRGSGTFGPNPTRRTEPNTIDDNGLLPDFLEGPADAVSNLNDAASRTGAWVSDRNNWIRVAKVVAGGALIIVGAAKLATPAAAKVAGAVAPVGKIGKALK